MILNEKQLSKKYCLKLKSICKSLLTFVMINRKTFSSRIIPFFFINLLKTLSFLGFEIKLALGATTDLDKNFQKRKLKIV